MTDETLRSPADYAFNAFFVLIGVLTFAISLGNITYAVAEISLERQAEALARKGITREAIIHMDADQNGVVDRLEFISSMLVEWGRCTHADLKKLNDLFDHLDTDRSGTIGEEDIRK